MLMQMLYEAAARRPQGAAVVCGNDTMTYGEVVAQTEQFARGLASLGISQGDRVALVHANSPEFVLSFFAVSALGAIVVPLNPQLQTEELRRSFLHCRIRAVVTHALHARKCPDILPERTCNVIVTDSDAPPETIAFRALTNGHPAGRLPSAAGELDAVYQYSSGSTGRQKRLARTHEQCCSEASSFVTSTALGPDDRIFCAIPLFHTHGQGNCLLAAVRAAATLVILEEPTPFVIARQRALEVLERQRVTVFPGVPFLFRLLSEASGSADLSALRLCFSAGTALPQSTFESFHRKFGVPVRQLYGCTEAGALTINLDADPEPSAPSVGKPLAGVQLRVVDDAGRPLPAGEVGQIAVSTPAMARGYHEMENHNREVFRDGFFFTGDLGRLDGEGRLWITGRKKRFIEVSGNKVDPAEVEDVLSAHPQVREAVVVGVAGPVNGEEIVKAVVVAAGPVDQKELVGFCQQRLARFKVPQIVEFRDEIPRSALGKILRAALV